MHLLVQHPLTVAFTSLQIMKASNRNTIDNSKTHFLTNTGDKVNELLFITNCASILRIHCFLTSYQLLNFSPPNNRLPPIITKYMCPLKDMMEQPY